MPPNDGVRCVSVGVLRSEIVGSRGRRREAVVVTVPVGMLVVEVVLLARMACSYLYVGSRFGTRRWWGLGGSVLHLIIVIAVVGEH